MDYPTLHLHHKHDADEAPFTTHCAEGAGAVGVVYLSFPLTLLPGAEGGGMAKRTSRLSR